MEYTIRCIQCCLACVECIVKFINTQAYIQIALRGRNFCYAAKDGFELVWSNPLRYSIVGGIGNIIMLLGKVAIASLTAFLFYLFITYIESVRQNYTEPFLQVLVTYTLLRSSPSSATSSASCSCQSTPSPWTPCCSASSWMRPTRRPRARVNPNGPQKIWPTSWTSRKKRTTTPRRKQNDRPFVYRPAITISLYSIHQINPDGSPITTYGLSVK